MLHEKTGIPLNQKPYTITKFVEVPMGKPLYHQMFIMPYESAKALQLAMAAVGMQAVATDVNRIFSGGAPTIMLGV